MNFSITPLSLEKGPEPIETISSIVKKDLFVSSDPERYFFKQSISFGGITAGFPELVLQHLWCKGLD